MIDVLTEINQNSIEGIAGALTITSALEDTLNTNKLVRHRKMFYRFGFGSHQPADNSDPYRLGHHSSLDSDAQRTSLDDESLSNKKRLSAVSYFAGVLHSPRLRNSSFLGGIHF